MADMGRVAKQAPVTAELAMTRVIDELRLERGLTQAQLAAGAGISQPLVSRILSGERSATLTELLGLCRAVGVELSELARRAGA